MSYFCRTKGLTINWPKEKSSALLLIVSVIWMIFNIASLGNSVDEGHKLHPSKGQIISCILNLVVLLLSCCCLCRSLEEKKKNSQEEDVLENPVGVVHVGERSDDDDEHNEPSVGSLSPRSSSE